jgi:hypothetical protein
MNLKDAYKNSFKNTRRSSTTIPFVTLHNTCRSFYKANRIAKFLYNLTSYLCLAKEELEFQK